MKSTTRRLSVSLALLGPLAAGTLARPAQEGEKGDESPAPPKVEKPEDAKGWTPPKIPGVDLGKVKVETPAEVSSPPSAGAKNHETIPFQETERADVRLVMEEGADTYDFGKLAQGESPSHTFEMKVEGEEDLVIKRIKASCGCTVAQSEVVSPAGERRGWTADEPIAPGSAVEVKATLKTESKHDDVTTNVAIYSNDGEFAVRRLTLKARVQPIVEVQPPSHNFGQITPFDEVEGAITLRSPEGVPFDVELMDTNTLRDELRVELVPIDPNEEGKSATWEARLALGPDLEEGIKNYLLRFKTDVPIENGQPGPDGEQPTHEYRAYAMAQVQGLIYTTPNYLAFGMMRPGEIQPRTFRIHTRDPEFEFPESPEVSVRGFKGDFELPDNIEVVARRAPDKKSLEVDVKVFDLPEDFEGSFSGFVEVGVNHPTKKTVRERFSGIARPGIQQPGSR